MINPENDKISSSKAGDAPTDFNQEEMTEMIDGVLSTLKTKFEDLSTQILSRMDLMSERMDEMEKSLVELLESSQEKSAADQDLK